MRENEKVGRKTNRNKMENKELKKSKIRKKEER
jgi:hypothetical protein